MVNDILTNEFAMLKRHMKYIEKTDLVLFSIYHPGEYIEEYLEGMNLSIQDFSKSTHLSTATLKSLLLHKKSIHEEIALKLEVGTHISKGTWLNLQKNYDQELKQAITEYNTIAYHNLLNQVNHL